MRLECGEAKQNGREELEWKGDLIFTDELLVRGIYLNGSLTEVSYHSKLADGRAALNQDGSLTIYSLEDWHTGNYHCVSEYRWVITDLTIFGKYICELFIYNILVSFDAIKGMQVPMHGWKGKTNGK